MSVTPPLEDPPGTPENPGAGESVLIRLQQDAGRVRQTFRLVASGVAAGVLGVHLAGTGVLTWLVFTHPVPYPVMYPLMGLVLWLSLATRFSALFRGRRRSAALSLFLNALLHGFWIAVLIDQVPPRPVFLREVVERPSFAALVVPMALYLVAFLGTVAHGVLWGRAHRQGPPG